MLGRGEERLRDLLKEFAYYATGRAVACWRRLARRLCVWFGKWVEKMKGRFDDLATFLVTLLVVMVVVLIWYCVIFFALAKFSIPTLWQMGALTIGSALTLASINASRRDENVQILNAFQQRERKLDGNVEADGAPYNAAAVLRGATSFDRENFLNEFRAIPKDSKSVILVLRQTRKNDPRARAPYTLESLQRQLQHWKEHKRLRKIEVKWVCIENKHNTVEAYLPYSQFEAEVLCGNAAYTKLISTGDLREFRKRMTDAKKAEESQKKNCNIKRNILVGLKRDRLPIKTSRREALSYMVRSRKGDVMLVADDGKRFGILSLYPLLEQSLTHLMPSPGAIAGLDKKIGDWIGKLDEKMDDEEDSTIPSPPDETSDDSPEYDSKLPSYPSKNAEIAVADLN